MVTKPPSNKATKKRASKTRPEKATKRGATKTSVKKKRPARKAAVKKRATHAPARLGAPDEGKPAEPETEQLRSAPESVPAASPAPVPAAPPVPVASRPPEQRPRPESREQDRPRPAPSGSRSVRRSYLEGVPRDHADLVAGLIQVVRGAAKDLRTLVTQAISMSHNKDDRSGR